jgi:hypothetical protein
MLLVFRVCDIVCNSKQFQPLERALQQNPITRFGTELELPSAASSENELCAIPSFSAARQLEVATQRTIKN